MTASIEGAWVFRVLIAEDDLMIADMIEEVLVAGGYDVCGIARTVDGAVELGGRLRPDLAIIDYRLANGGLGTDAAAPLVRRNPRLGVLYVTGNSQRVEATATEGHACMSKPVRSADLLRGLQLVREIVATGTAEPPFPANFRVLKRSAHAAAGVTDA